MLASFLDLMGRGGWVMWPLGLLSLLAVTLIFERCWFRISTRSGARRRRLDENGRRHRIGQTPRAEHLATTDTSVYGDLLQQLLSEGTSEASVSAGLESQRPRLERFMPTLGTIITAAPMLGILGTVTGIIRAFNVLSDKALTDPTQIAGPIAEALLTTVAGLVVALVVLFPYNAFRAQIDRTVGRMHALAAAARESRSEEVGDES
mgnify:CR=1 FL=1